MSSGYSSRAGRYGSRSANLGTSLWRAVSLHLEQRDAVLEAFNEFFAPENGIALLWLEPWDKDESLSLKVLDPYFIEICRRVRLRRDAENGAIFALGQTSKGPRVDAEAQVGNLGDLWTAINKKKATALTIGHGGFHYRKVVEILFSGAYHLPPSMEIKKGDSAETLIHLSVLVRGEGGTDGLYERFLDAKHPKAKKRDELHKLANGMIKDDVDNAKKALKIGLLTMLQGGPETLNFKDKRADLWTEMLDHRIDEIFFGHFWAMAEVVDNDDQQDAARRDWQKALVENARTLFETALDQVPVPSGRRERARALAENAFDGMLHKHLPLAFSAK
ncbi:hypothetical protein CCP2SC5_1130002 [Azospirillaceae bacterium]